MDHLLIPFYRQYLQQVNPSTIRYPPPKHLIISFVQDQIYRYCFNEENDSFLPPPSYRHKVLKRIIGDIERELRSGDHDPDEYAISDTLMSSMGTLATSPQVSETEEAQKPRVLSYFLPTNTAAAHNIETASPAFDELSKRILIRESPNLLAAGSNVGLRTWESCLHLAYYLSTNPNLKSQHKRGRGIQNANIIELGSGTGLLSLICALQLHANNVIVTDGLLHVVEGINANIELNDPETEFPNSKAPIPALLGWNDPSDIDKTLSLIKTSNSDNDIPEYNCDYILGADITYHPELFDSLANVIRILKDRFPSARVLICTTVRKETSLKLFHDVCEEKYGLSVRDIVDGNGKDGEGWKCPGFREQTGLFHEQGFPIVIMDVDLKV